MKTLIFIIYGILGLTQALHIPSSTRKCSLKDPKFNDCIVEKANIVIPDMVEGVEEIGLPVMSPLHTPKINLEGQKLVINLTDTYTGGFKNTKVKEVIFDIPNGKGNATLSLDVFNITGKYSIKNGQVLSRSISGSGKFNMTLSDVVITYNENVRVIEKNGKSYLEICKVTVELTSKHGRYDFENLQSPEEGDDIGGFINENWQTVFEEMKPSLENFLGLVIKRALEAYIQFPITDMFLP